MIYRITLTALFLAATMLGTASLAGPRHASAAVDPACQALVDNLRSATLATGVLNQTKLNEAVACLNSTSATPAGTQTSVVQPANGIAAMGSISGVLYPISLSQVSPIEFCDTLYIDYTVDPSGGWYGIGIPLGSFPNLIGAYSNGIGRGGYWLGTFAFVAEGVYFSPTSFVQFAGFGTLSPDSCGNQQEE